MWSNTDEYVRFLQIVEHVTEPLYDPSAADIMKIYSRMKQNVQWLVHPLS